MTQKGIKELVRIGAAVDITGCNKSTLDKIHSMGSLDRIATSAGKYGINAALYQLRDRETLEPRGLYAVTGRSQTLFMI